MAAKLGHLAQGAASVLCLLIFFVEPSDSRAQARISGGNGTCISRERDALLSFKASLLCQINPELLVSPDRFPWFVFSFRKK